MTAPAVDTRPGCAAGQELPELCPACLTELPDEYPYDHVRIDRAIAGNPALFRSMADDEQREVVTAGRRQGMTNYAIAVRIGSTSVYIATLMDEDITAELNQSVAELHAKGLNDLAISLHVGCHRGVVAKVRQRLGLETLYGPGGRRKKAEAGA